MIFAVDPGPDFCGVVSYEDATTGTVFSCSAMSVWDAVIQVQMAARRGERIAIERVQSTGQSGASLLRTSETVGRLWQAGLTVGGSVTLVYRREVLRALDVTGKGNRDAMVRQRLLEMHGGSRAAACGNRANPGVLYGVAGHSWQALGVAVAALHGAGEVVT